MGHPALQKTGRFTKTWSLIGGLALLSATGCQEVDLTDTDVGAEQNASYGSYLPPDVVLEWNANTIDVLTVDNGYQDPLIASRTLAMVNLAMHNAINATDYRVFRTYKGYSQYDDDAEPRAAAASAAHRVLANLFPAQAADIKARLDASLLDVPDGDEENAGVALGDNAGNFILQLRAQDGINNVLPYTPGTAPGDYQFTVPGFIFRPGWQNVTPFALTSSAQFRPSAPPSLTSLTYTRDFEEVKRQGRIDSTARSANQSAIAQFWYETSELGWNRVAQVVIEEEELGLANAARLLALVAMSSADGYIAGWEAKFHYDFWRPITAIRAASTDGNGSTSPDATWEPFLGTPPVQDYPSTHSVLGAAAAEVLKRYFMDDYVSFTMGSTTFGGTRSFSSFTQASNENADSRVQAGIHFRFAAEAGKSQGRQIGAHIFNNFLRPR